MPTCVAKSAIFYIFFSPPAFAASDIEVLSRMCSDVLSTASTTYENNQNIKIIQSRGEAMCKKHFTSSQSFRSSADSLGISYKDAASAFGLDASHSDNNQDFHQAYDKYCSSESQYAMDERLIHEKGQSLTDAAYEAHRFCVGQLSSIINTLHLGNLVLLADAVDDKVDLTIKAFNGITMREVQAIKMDAGLQCRLDNDVNVLTPPRRLKENLTSVFLQCDRMRVGQIKVSVRTEVGITNEVLIPAQENEIDNLKSQITANSEAVARTLLMIESLGKELHQLEDRAENNKSLMINKTMDLLKKSPLDIKSGIEHCHDHDPLFPNHNFKDLSVKPIDIAVTFKPPFSKEPYVFASVSMLDLVVSLPANPPMPDGTNQFSLTTQMQAINPSSNGFHIFVGGAYLNNLHDCDIYWIAISPPSYD